MGKKIRLGVILYKEVDEEGNTWYIALEPMSGAQVQGTSREEVINRIKDEISKMLGSWCESELKEAVDAFLVEVELPEE